MNAMDLLLQQIEDSRASLARAIVDGSARDYAEYKHLSGEIQGLSRAFALVEDMKRRVENDDD